MMMEYIQQGPTFPINYSSSFENGAVNATERVRKHCMLEWCKKNIKKSTEMVFFHSLLLARS
jgi:hypothetical protein